MPIVNSLLGKTRGKLFMKAVWMSSYSRYVPRGLSLQEGTGVNLALHSNRETKF
jgi:hypothetical protein